eukprot:3906597-Pleurochrysis_carterae.AAC.1
MLDPRWQARGSRGGPDNFCSRASCPDRAQIRGFAHKNDEKSLFTLNLAHPRRREAWRFHTSASSTPHQYLVHGAVYTVSYVASCARASQALGLGRAALPWRRKIGDEVVGVLCMTQRRERADVLRAPNVGRAVGEERVLLDATVTDGLRAELEPFFRRRLHVRGEGLHAERVRVDSADGDPEPEHAADAAERVLHRLKGRGDGREEVGAAVLRVLLRR